MLHWILYLLRSSLVEYKHVWAVRYGTFDFDAKVNSRVAVPIECRTFDRVLTCRSTRQLQDKLCAASAASVLLTCSSEALRLRTPEQSMAKLEAGRNFPFNIYEKFYRCDR